MVGTAGSRIEMYGRPFERTWTLLAANAEAGATVLTLKHDPVQMGWAVGDEIGIATTRRSDAPRRFITSIDGNQVK